MRRLILFAALLVLVPTLALAQSGDVHTAEVLSGRVILSTAEAGDVVVAVDSQVDSGDEARAERVFVFQPLPGTAEAITADLAEARVLYRHRRQLIVTDRSGPDAWIFSLASDSEHEAPSQMELLDLAQNLERGTTAVAPTMLEGYGLAEYKGSYPLLPQAEDGRVARPVHTDDGLLSSLLQEPEREDDECEAGGEGSTGCSIGCGGGHSCSVECTGGHYTCCNCEEDGPSCECRL